MTAIVQNLKWLVNRFIDFLRHILHFVDLFGLQETLLRRFIKGRKFFAIELQMSADHGCYIFEVAFESFQ
jgi:hypothetical protein